jgi:hypothetical protein
VGAVLEGGFCYAKSDAGGAAEDQDAGGVELGCVFGGLERHLG